MSNNGYPPAGGYPAAPQAPNPQSQDALQQQLAYQQHQLQMMAWQQQQQQYYHQPGQVNVVVQQNAGGGGFVRTGNRSKLAAACFAFFLGGLGAHKFYLNRAGMGIFYLLFCWTLIPAIVAFFETFLLLLMDENEFDMRYNGRLS